MKGILILVRGLRFGDSSYRGVGYRVRRLHLLLAIHDFDDTLNQISLIAGLKSYALDLDHTLVTSWTWSRWA